MLSFRLIYLTLKANLLVRLRRYHLAEHTFVRVIDAVEENSLQRSCRILAYLGLSNVLLSQSRLEESRAP
ncbi:MAG TPA: hypothetical protein PLP17_15060, partial [Oligoflexia bacterium]|nr:hypothetical protein [Oligoflexia bacterium]